MTDMDTAAAAEVTEGPSKDSKPKANRSRKAKAVAKSTRKPARKAEPKAKAKPAKKAKPRRSPAKPGGQGALAAQGLHLMITRVPKKVRDAAWRKVRALQKRDASICMNSWIGGLIATAVR